MDYITKSFNPIIVEVCVCSQLAVSAKNRAAAVLKNFSEVHLQELVSTGESDTVEFKTTLRYNLHTGKSDKKIENGCLKTIAAFLNSAGGVLLVGVDDNGNAVDLAPDNFKNEDKQLLHWNIIFNAYLGVEFSQYVRAEIKNLHGEQLLLIQCLVSPQAVCSPGIMINFFISGQETARNKRNQVRYCLILINVSFTDIEPSII